MVQTKSSQASRIVNITVALTVISLSTLMQAQSSDTAGAPADAKEKIAATIKESIAKNQAALKQYTWTENTQISLKGEVKKQEENQCQYGADGKVQKTPIGNPADSQSAQQSSGGSGRRGGEVKKAMIEKKVDELKDYMQQVQALVKEYVPPDPKKIQAAQAAGNVSLQPPAGGIATMNIKNYEKQGDLVKLGFDTNAKKLRSFDVNSYTDNPKDDPVTLTVTFASLPDGTNYVQQSVLDAPAKKIQVNTTNSDYKKLGQ
jgi:hypothetical protein